MSSEHTPSVVFMACYCRLGQIRQEFFGWKKHDDDCWLLYRISEQEFKRATGDSSHNQDDAPGDPYGKTIEVSE
jgi:hypothetical protein